MSYGDFAKEVRKQRTTIQSQAKEIEQLKAENKILKADQNTLLLIKDMVDNGQIKISTETDAVNAVKKLLDHLNSEGE